MGVDHETKPTFFNLVIDDRKKYLDALRKQANEDGQNDEKADGNKLSITNDAHIFDMCEYYFDEKDCTFFISGEAKSPEGNTYISFSLPVSDIVLIDILTHGLKKLQKLKNTMETLK